MCRETYTYVHLSALHKHASSFVSYFDNSALVSLLNKSMISIKYETNDDACFDFCKSALVSLLNKNMINKSMRQMMTHASLKKHASSFVSHVCWSAHR